MNSNNFSVIHVIKKFFVSDEKAKKVRGFHPGKPIQPSKETACLTGSLLLGQAMQVHN
jgi:hypothetical protein